MDLRCSHVDRERVAEALRNAAGDGRLTLTELDERLEAAFNARTYGDLQPITQDLPQGPYPIPGNQPTSRWATPPDQPPAQRVTPGPPALPAQRITAILSEEKRTGRWDVPHRLDVMSVFGAATLDFSEADVRSAEVVISGAVVLGQLTIIVPEGADVRLETSANVLGERKSKMREPVVPGGPVFRVRSLVVLGEIVVKPPKGKKRHLSP
jgi:hypothetical protein